MRTIHTLAAIATLSVPFATANAQQNTSSDEMPDYVYVTLATNMGDVLLELNHDKAPVSVENFVRYVEDGYYDGTIFHRVIPNFMIQGGGFTREGEKKDTGDAITNEWENGLKNDAFTVAMARLGAQPDSATSQFFINVQDNDFLDQPRDGAGYAVFGKVIEGFDTVMKIRGVETETNQTPAGPMPNWPSEAVVIEEAKIVGESRSRELRGDREAREASLPEMIEKTLAEAKLAVFEEKLSKAKETLEGMGYDVSEGEYDAGTGLWSLIVEEGDGETSPSASDTVQVHYTGWLTDGKKFDSSRDRGAPAEFPLNRVIRGWTVGVAEMTVGERRIMVIPPDMAYGERGRPSIPGNSALIFDVELLDVK